MLFGVQFIGWIVLGGLATKLAYDFARFLYTVRLASIFGRNLDPFKYGPWAGESLLSVLKLTNNNGIFL